MAIKFSELLKTKGSSMPLNIAQAQKFFQALNNEYKYFMPDNTQHFEQFAEIFKICNYFARHHSDYYNQLANNYNDFLTAKNAYKMLILFGKATLDDTLNTFDQFIQKHYDEDILYGSYDVPVETNVLIKIDLLRCSEYGRPPYNLEGWRALLEELGSEITENMDCLSMVESFCDGVPQNADQFYQAMIPAQYTRYRENPELAKLASKYEILEIGFNRALANMKSNSHVKTEVSQRIALDMAAEFAKLPAAKQSHDYYRVKKDGRANLGSDMESAYFIELPKDNIRYNLFSANPNDDISELLCVMISKNPEKDLDLQNIDWDNLDSDGHEIVSSYSFYRGPGNILFVDHHFFQNIHGEHGWSFSKIIGRHILERFPGAEVVIDVNNRGDKGASFWPFYNYGLDEKSHGYFDMVIVLPSSYVQLKSLEQEYISRIKLQDAFFLLSPFVLGVCSDKASILAVHAEIEELKKDNAQRYELLSKCIRNVPVAFHVSYDKLKTLPNETLKFLSSIYRLPADLPLKEIVDNAQDLSELKREFLKHFFISINPTYAEDFNSFDDVIINNFIDAKIYNHNTFGPFNLMDFIGMDSKKIQLLVSEYMRMIYERGYAECRGFLYENITEVKAKIISFLLDIGKPKEYYGKFSKAVLRMSEEQIDYLMYSLSDGEPGRVGFTKMIEFMLQNPEASRKDIDLYDFKLALELRADQYLGDISFSDLSKEQISMLKEAIDGPHRLESFSIGFLLSLKPELARFIVSNLYSYGHYKIDPEDLAKFNDPGKVVKLYQKYGAEFLTLDMIDRIGIDVLERLYDLDHDKYKNLVKILDNKVGTMDQIEKIFALQVKSTSDPNGHIDEIFSNTALEIYRTGYISFALVVDWFTNSYHGNSLSGILGNATLLLAQQGGELPEEHYPKINGGQYFSGNASISWIMSEALRLKRPDYFTDDVLGDLDEVTLCVLAQLNSIALEDLVKLNVSQLSMINNCDNRCTFDDLLGVHNFVLD
jgi:hypothetical protein